MLLSFVLVLFAVSTMAWGQKVIDNFESPRPDTALTSSVEGDLSRITITQNTTDKHEGTSSMDVNVVIGAYHPWGSYSNVGYKNVAGETLDWSLSDSLSIWIKVLRKPLHPEYMVMRISIDDRPTAGDARESYIYENGVIVDTTTNWVNLRVPILERVQPGTEIPNDQGFILAPTSWGGFTYNNRKLDRDKIFQWTISLVTSGYTAGVNLPADSLHVLFDNFTRFGTRAVPVMIFNGKDVAPSMTQFVWGQSAASVEIGAGPGPKKNAIKWVQGNEWNNGWTGFGYDVKPGFNIAGGWPTDSLKAKYKAEAGVGAIRFQFESPIVPPATANSKVGKVITPIADNQWHSVSLALRDFVPEDGTSHFDSSNAYVFGIMAEASATAGKVVYFSDIWTGNPVFDVIAPDAPTGVQAAGGGFLNLITWNDVPNETGARYNVYVSDKAWTDPADLSVEDVPPYNLGTGAQLATHYLRAPNTDQNVSLYYGIVAKDAAGNESLPGLAPVVTTKAKGVPTISLTPPTNFAADGDLSEWGSVKPFVLNTQRGTAHAVPNFPITDSMDLSAKAYVAINAQYLYVAFDVTDDVVLVDTAAAVNDYEQDCPDLFIGLYDWRGKYHSGLTGGAKPEYHFRFSKNRLRLDNGGAILAYATAGNPNYSWTEKVLESGYIVEARIPLTQLATALASRNDQLFVPVEGKRIPIDFAVNDQDVKGTRNGIMCYSILTNDNSYSDMFYWTYTWIGNKWTGIKQTGEIARSYELSQNYPNPFNPSTQINYSLQKSGMVSLNVYDMLGREVTSLVNAYQQTGTYTVTFNTSDFNLASGIYFYRLQTGPFVAMHKMVLLK